MVDSKSLKSNELVTMISNYFASGDGKEAVQKVQGIFQIDILDKKGGKVVKQFYIDLKNGNGKCAEGTYQKYSALFTIPDADFYKICNGTLNPQMAFINGTMKIKGNMKMATKFTPDLFPKPTPENMKKYAQAKF